MDTVHQHLSKIVKPTDIHKLSDAEVVDLAAEVRRAILERVSKSGGHFGSSLGTVELTVALYAVYHLPPDKVIWDTGHQAYPHKILTGRLEGFKRLRKHKGLRGFLSRAEHELDYFGAGHAGTSISAALGFAVARDRLGGTERVVAVTGDASICNGMSWEALNHAGDLKTDFTVVLNDNRMSIAPNVGALTEYFTRLRSRPFLQEIVHRTKHALEKLPSPLTRAAAGIRHGVTHYFAPEETGTIFEEIGFEYIGPIDGHDVRVLLEIFRNVRQLKGPVFVHAITTKGKGYTVAEEDARKWHAVIPFELSSCEMIKPAGPVTYSQVFGDAAMQCAKEDHRVVAITAAMPDGTGLTQFSKECPDQYFDTGIAEEHAVTLAAGMAAGGLRPFCAIYSTFLQRGFDQLIHDVCLQNLPVRFFLDRAGLAGDDGPTHHGAFDLSYLNLMPNMRVIAPRDTTELREMVHFMKSYEDHSIAVRYPRGADAYSMPEERTKLEFGKAEVLSEGDDLTICAVGSMVGTAWEACKVLEKEGLRICVINARFVKPFDGDTILEYASRSKRLITIEENAVIGGFGQQVRSFLYDAGALGIKHEIMGLPDHFIEHGDQALIRFDAQISVEHLVNRVRHLARHTSRSPM